jgi:hypothetical protein
VCFKKQKKNIFPFGTLFARFALTKSEQVDLLLNIISALARRRGKVVSASSSRTEDPGFESRQGVRSSHIAVLLSKPNMHCQCAMFEIK